MFKRLLRFYYCCNVILIDLLFYVLFIITRSSTLVGMSTWTAGSFCLCCFWQVMRCLWSLHMSGIPCHMDLQPSRNIYLTSWFILSVLFFDRQWDVCGPDMGLGVPVTGTSNPVGMSSKPAGSFCLCCFWQVVRCLWYLHVSGILRHTDLHPGRSVYVNSGFILSVLFWEVVRDLC